MSPLDREMSSKLCQMFDFRFRFRISDLSSRVLTLQLKLQLVIYLNPYKLKYVKLNI